jgi:hypothetical protein
MTTQPRSRGASLAIWIGLNLLRLFGVGVIVAGIAVQGLLLVRSVWRGFPSQAGERVVTDESIMIIAVM